MLKPIGITDDITDCECCGRTGLKRTVMLRGDDNAIRHYGTTCASRAIYGFSSAAMNRKVKNDALWAQTSAANAKKLAADRAKTARKVLQLLDEGKDRDPLVLAIKADWGRANDPFTLTNRIGEEFMGWRRWLEARAAVA